MRTSTVKAVWERGGLALGTVVKSKDPIVTEILSQLKLDFLWMDLEHSSTSLETFSNLARAARAGQADVMARPARWEYMRMGRLLEAGAQGILYPRCESAEEAAEVVKWAKFHPLGERGFDGGSADNNYGSYPADSYTAAANANTWVTIQVESPRALDHVEAIAAVEGVDCVFFGPGDYSALSGRPGQVKHPETLKAAEQIARATIKAGKIYGTLVFDMEHAQTMKDMGAQLLAHSAESLLMKAAYENIIEAYTPLR